jgi:hypothetical protein
VVLAPVAVDDVERAITLLEPLLDVGQEHPVLFLLVVEEGADVPGAAEDRTGQPDLLGVTHCVTPCCQYTPGAGRPRGRTSTPGNGARSTTARERGGMIPRKSDRISDARSCCHRWISANPAIMVRPSKADMTLMRTILT